MTSSFSAGPQSLGFFYQARMALLLLLQCPDEVVAAIEGLDDIELKDEKSKSVKQKLFQLKHHVSREANLTDSSEDLWKTIRVWCAAAGNRHFPLTDRRLFLVTTARVQIGSIASMLLAEGRDPREAENRLIAIASTSSNKKLKSAFAAFLKLSPAARSSLVSCVYVLDEQPNIDEVKDKIKAAIRPAIRREFLEQFFERIEGWWFDIVVQHLLYRGKRPTISSFDVNEKIADIAQGFHQENLPVDYLHELPDDQFVSTSKDKTFVRQLLAIKVQPRTVSKAIIDYYKAFCQRSRWLADGLIYGEELSNYEKSLIDEWERYCDALQDEGQPATEQELLKIGRQVFQWANQESTHLRIRPRVDADFVRRGSFHLLADRSPTPSVHWHPQFLDLLSKTVSAATNEEGK